MEDDYIITRYAIKDGALRLTEMFGSLPNGNLLFDGHQVFYNGYHFIYEDIEFRLDPTEWERWKPFAVEGMKKYRENLSVVESTTCGFRLTNPDDSYEYLELSYTKPIVRVTRRNRD